jgi:hypothetical protein
MGGMSLCRLARKVRRESRVFVESSAMAEKVGGSMVVRRSLTRWQAAHQRRARAWPRAASGGAFRVWARTGTTSANESKVIRRRVFMGPLLGQGEISQKPYRFLTPPDRSSEVKEHPGWPAEPRNSSSPPLNTVDKREHERLRMRVSGEQTGDSPAQCYKTYQRLSNKRPEGRICSVRNRVGEHPRKSGRRRLGGSAGTGRLTSSDVNRNPGKGFRPAGNCLAWADISSAPKSCIQTFPPATV